MNKTLHQKKPEGSSEKHSDDEEDDNRWRDTHYGNQSGMRHELSQPSPQGHLARDSRDEHESKETKTQARMLATWKAGAGFVRATLCFHLISPLASNSNNEAHAWPASDRCGLISSNEIKFRHRLYLRNFGREPSRQRGRREPHTRLDIGMKAKPLKPLVCIAAENHRSEGPC